MEPVDVGASKRKPSAEPEDEAKRSKPADEDVVEVETEPVGLLDLSDDVLLCVLQYCSPRDLKALGFSCPRLGRLIVDRSLWCRVDARAHPVGHEQLRWYLRHTLGAHTTKLALSGFADESRGCLGTVETLRPDIYKMPTSSNRDKFLPVDQAAGQPSTSIDAPIPPDGSAESQMNASTEPPRPDRPKAPVQSFDSASSDCCPNFSPITFSTNAKTMLGEGPSKDLAHARMELEPTMDDPKCQGIGETAMDAASKKAQASSIQDIHGETANESKIDQGIKSPSTAEVQEPSSMEPNKATTHAELDQTTSAGQEPRPADPLLHPIPNLRLMLSSTDASTTPVLEVDQADNPTSQVLGPERAPASALLHPSPNLRGMLASTSAESASTHDSNRPASPDRDLGENVPESVQGLSKDIERLRQDKFLRRILLPNNETAKDRIWNRARRVNGPTPSEGDQNGNTPEPVEGPSARPGIVHEHDLLRRILYSNNETAQGQGMDGEEPNGSKPSDLLRNKNTSEPVQGPSGGPETVHEHDLLKRIVSSKDVAADGQGTESEGSNKGPTNGPIPSDQKHNEFLRQILDGCSNNATAEGQGTNREPANGPIQPVDAQNVPDLHQDRPAVRKFLCRRPCLHSRQRSHYRQLPRFSVGPAWRVQGAAEGAEGACVGPRWTLARSSLVELRATCPALTELRLQRCNIDCNVTQISDFPKTLKVLSLRGSRCFNLEVNKSYLFRIQDFMPNLEEVDVSECHWMEPATLLPLSKLPELRVLRAVRCLRLTECVAYASLASRYGFRKLKVLELYGTPMGDSEVSGLGWLPELEELYLEPADASYAPVHHSHYLDDQYVTPAELEPWEQEEPEYFRIEQSPDEVENAEVEDCSEQVEEEDQEIAMNFGGQAPGVHRSPAFLNWFEEIRREQRAPASQDEPRGEVDPDEPPAKRARLSDRVTVNRESDHAPKKNSEEPSTSKQSNIPDAGNRTGSDLGTNVKGSSLGSNGSSLASTTEGSPSTSTCFKRRVTSNDDPSPSKSPISDGISPGTQSPPSSPASHRRAPRVRPPVERSPDQQRELNERIAERMRMDIERDIEQDQEVQMRRVVRQEQNRIDEMEDYLGQGRVQVIYVNVRRPRNEMFRMLLGYPQAANGADAGPNRGVVDMVELPPDRANEEVNGDEDEGANALRNGPNFAIMPDFNRPVVNNQGQVMNILRMPFVQNFLYGPATGPGHLGGPSLITDAAINRFGHSEGPNTVNYVHIGPNGAFRAGAPPGNGSDRPNKSRLRVLVCRGFSGVTVRSLDHLVTAAPALRHLDVTGTKVTERDVVAFKNLRPECEVKYTKTNKWTVETSEPIQ